MVFQLPARVDEIFGKAELGPFTLGQVHGLPEQDYHNRKSLYDELEDWFDGTNFDVQQTQGARTVDKYPLKLNPIRGACYKHAFALWGEAANDSRPLATPAFSDATDKTAAQLGTNFLNGLWAENHGRSIQMRNGLISQYLGGSVYKLTYVPNQEWRRWPIKIESIYPTNFVGIPISGDEFRLEEAWFVKAITPQEAMRKYSMDFEAEVQQGVNVYLVEYWNPEYWDTTINGRTIPKKAIDPDTGERDFYRGDNPFKFVPASYIPHIRENSFYGTPLITPNVTGIAEEMNKRMADYGDAVSDDAHRYYVIKNSSGKPDVFELAPGLRVVQLQGNPSITGKEDSPDMEQLGSSQASEPMHNLTSDLNKEFNRETFLSAVTYGEDEGSQRSGRTLDIRFWPLSAHIGMERVWTGDGLAHLNSMAVEMGLIVRNMPISSKHKKNLAALTEEMREMRMETRFAPLLPRDRELFINELISRASANLGTLEHLLSLIDDVEDPAGMAKQVVKQIKELALIDASIRKSSQNQNQNQNQDQNQNQNQKQTQENKK
jgi:hypothetical protein